MEFKEKYIPALLGVDYVEPFSATGPKQFSFVANLTAHLCVESRDIGDCKEVRDLTWLVRLVDDAQQIAISFKHVVTHKFS